MGTRTRTVSAFVWHAWGLAPEPQYARPRKRRNDLEARVPVPQEPEPMEDMPASRGYRGVSPVAIGTSEGCGGVGLACAGTSPAAFSGLEY